MSLKTFNNHKYTQTLHLLIIWIIFLLILLPISAFGVDNVRLQLKWRHQFQFAGYYAAQAQGYYRDAGLNVEIIPATPGIDPVQQVVQGKADFGIGATDLLLLREKGVPVVVLASIFQHSPLAFMVLKKEGLQTIHDLAGAKVMLEPDSAELHAYLKYEGIPLANIKQLPHSFDVHDLLSGKVDAMSVYVTTEPFVADKAKRDYLLFSPRADGIDFYSDNLFTMDSMIKRNPEVVRKFRAASLKGWEYAMSHQEELIQLISHQYSKHRDVDDLRFEAKQMESLLQTKMVEIGHMNPGRWRNIIEVYADMGMLKRNFNIKGFLYDPYPAPPDLRWLYEILGAVILLLLIVTLAAVRYARLLKDLTISNNNLKKTEEELRIAFDDIRTLRGILPICSCCKKIRDDVGNWRQMEVYIRDRTHAKFSHGICPECVKKEYPDYYEEEK